MSRRFRLIVNPSSGPGAAVDVARGVEALLRRAGTEVGVALSRGAEDMGRVVGAAVSAGELVVAVGGDGMIASVAGPVAELGGVLGIVPAGNGNDFARMLRLPSHAEGVASILLNGIERVVDLIEYLVPGFPRRIVIGSVYAGYDARNSLVANGMDWAPPGRKYELAAIHNLVGYTPDVFEVTVDGVTTHHRGASVAVANSGYYGGGVLVAPMANLADGCLEVVVVEAAGPREWMDTLTALTVGAHVERDDVKVFRGRSVALRAEAGDGGVVPAGGDGEPLPAVPTLAGVPARINVLPAALSVLAAGEGG